MRTQGVSRELREITLSCGAAPSTLPGQGKGLYIEKKKDVEK